MIVTEIFPQSRSGISTGEPTRTGRRRGATTAMARLGRRLSRICRRLDQEKWEAGTENLEGAGGFEHLDQRGKFGSRDRLNSRSWSITALQSVDLRFLRIQHRFA